MNKKRAYITSNIFMICRILGSHSGDFEEFYHQFAACFTLVSCLAYSPTLKMEATCSSETSVDI
jgi:hypothetical protein